MSRTAIVTGGASGIGRALVERLADAGYHVVVADLDLAGAERTAGQVALARPGAASAVRLDVRDESAVTDLVESTDRERGLDLMVNNAGIGVGGRTEEMTSAHWARQLDVNLWGVVHGSTAAYRLMRSRGHGQILNTASIAGLVAAPGLIAYTTSKHAVVGLSLALRAEAAAAGVRVSVLCPGWVDTPLLDQVNDADLPATSMTIGVREVIPSFGMGKPVSARAVAEAAVRGLERNRGLIVVPTTARLAWAGQRLAPSLTQRLSATIARRVQDQVAQRTARVGVTAGPRR